MPAVVAVRRTTRGSGVAVHAGSGAGPQYGAGDPVASGGVECSRDRGRQRYEGARTSLAVDENDAVPMLEAEILQVYRTGFALP